MAETITINLSEHRLATLRKLAKLAKEFPDINNALTDYLDHMSFDMLCTSSDAIQSHCTLRENLQKSGIGEAAANTMIKDLRGAVFEAKSPQK